jgi:hypothetical protein
LVAVLQDLVVALSHLLIVTGILLLNGIWLFFFNLVDFFLAHFVLLGELLLEGLGPLFFLSELCRACLTFKKGTHRLRFDLFEQLMVIGWRGRPLHGLLRTFIFIVFTDVLPFYRLLPLVFQDERRRLAVWKVEVAVISTFYGSWLILKRLAHGISWATDLLLHMLNSYLLNLLADVVFLILTLLN